MNISYDLFTRPAVRHDLISPKKYNTPCSRYLIKNQQRNAEGHFPFLWFITVVYLTWSQLPGSYAVSCSRDTKVQDAVFTRCQPLHSLWVGNDNNSEMRLFVCHLTPYICPAVAAAAATEGWFIARVCETWEEFLINCIIDLEWVRCGGLQVRQWGLAEQIEKQDTIGWYSLISRLGHLKREWIYDLLIVTVLWLGAFLMDAWRMCCIFIINILNCWPWKKVWLFPKLKSHISSFFSNHLSTKCTK